MCIGGPALALMQGAYLLTTVDYKGLNDKNRIWREIHFSTHIFSTFMMPVSRVIRALMIKIIFYSFYSSSYVLIVRWLVYI
jgi:hypothetical protein